MALKTTAKIRAKVLESFRKTGRIDRACQAHGYERSAFYRWLKKYPDFAAAFEACREEVAGLIEDQLHLLAFEGIDEPVFHAGKRAMDFARDENGQLIRQDCKVCQGKGCPTCGGTGKGKEFVAVPASIRRVFPNVALAIAAARIPAYKQGIAKTRIVGEDGEDRNIEVTVEYTNKSIPD